MKVLYISYDGILDPVGQSQIMPYVSGLQRKGVSVFLLSFEKKERLRKDSLATEKLIEGIYWSPLLYHRNPVIPATLFDVVTGFLQGLRLIRKNKIKIVHTRSYIPGLIGYLLKIFTGADFIFDTRGFWPEEKVDAGAWKENGALFKCFKWLEKKLVFKANHIIVLTEKAKDAVINQYGRRNISVIPCCVDLDIFTKKEGSAISNINLPLNRIFIAYSGSTGTFYNFEGMVKFFQAIKMVLPAAYFLILSNGNKRYIEDILRKQGIKQGDYFIASLPNKEVPAILSQAKFSLVLYRRNLSGYGCSPIKFAESLSCGVPVVVNSKVGDCAGLVKTENIGVVIKGESEQDYREAAGAAIRLMQQGEELCMRCRNAAKIYFSLKNGIEKYLDIYKGVTA